MPEPKQEKRGKVPLKPFLADFRSNMTDQGLRKKYGLSAQAFVSLIKALLAKQVVTPEDLARRREMAVQRDLARESEFLAGLFICPNCGHPSPKPFDVCPACGANVDDFLPVESLLDSLTTTGRIKVEEIDDVVEVEVIEEMDEAQGVLEVEEVEEIGGSRQESRVVESLEGREGEPEGEKKSSRLGSLRSLISEKLKKK